VKIPIFVLSPSLSHPDFDPVGVFCIIDKGELSSPISITEEFLLNDDDYPLRYLELHFRSKSQLVLLFVRIRIRILLTCMYRSLCS